MPDARRQERYIRRFVTDAVSVTWTPDETIHLKRRDGRTYTMWIGSDDEVYRFVNDADPHDVLTFPVED
jgi:hypothetical protein